MKSGAFLRGLNKNADPCERQTACILAANHMGTCIIHEDLGKSSGPTDTERVCSSVHTWQLPPTVARACMMRMRAARPQYGELNLVTDKRDFLNEAYEEILDAINYVAMYELQGHPVPLIRFGLKVLAWAFSPLLGGK